jgi:alpha-tubulin suppressor-like RCC1 family protein
MPAGLRLTAGGATTCVVTRAGAVKCWGFNFSGQLGLGDANHRGDEPGEMGAALPFLDFGSGRRVERVVIGGYFSCALLDDHSWKCWGRNTEGELGLGDKVNRGDREGQMGDALPRLDLGMGRHALDVAIGDYHACALLDDGSVKCWGVNTFGQLGLGDRETRGDQPSEMGDALPALDLGAGRSALAVAAGKSHSCVLLDDQSVKCWGLNVSWQLGLQDSFDRGDDPGEMGDNLPNTPLPPGRRVAALGLGNSRSCALLDDGTVSCWGLNSSGDVDLAGKVSTFALGRRATSLAVGAFYACAQLDDGSVTCWGANSNGLLGAGDKQSRYYSSLSPAVNLGQAPIVALSANGGYHTCALFTKDRVKCWGSNYEGELGLGDHKHRGDEPGEMGDELPFVKLGL